MPLDDASPRQGRTPRYNVLGGVLDEKQQLFVGFLAVEVGSGGAHER